MRIRGGGPSIHTTPRAQANRPRRRPHPRGATGVLTALLVLLILGVVLGTGLLPAGPASADEPPKITPEDVAHAERLFDIQLTPAERDSLLEDLADQLESYQALHGLSIPNAVPPALVFDPVPPGMTFDTIRREPVYSEPRTLEVPADTDTGLETLAYASVRDLGELLRTRRVTSEQLTRMYLERLKRYGPQLECVVTLLEDHALEQARRADAEIAAGRYRGPLHGIPYGAKDLLAFPGAPTTWGAMPYKDQVIDDTATVIRKLDQAGAVLVAKLTLGALAWGDVWFGGKTRNPWNLEQGSSGSSAGSASATAAGLVGFAIGTETWGSIVSPSTRCGTTGLRPTFGRVSRAGAMALSWSMDKIGPLCRTVEDCALVFDAIRGPDGLDASVRDLPFNYDARLDARTLRVGYVKEAFEADYANKEHDAATLDVLRRLGVQLVPMALPSAPPVRPLAFILSSEAAAAFDELTRSNRDDLLVRQIKNAWPNVLRAARFIPAVEYVQANRARYQLLVAMGDVMRDLDAYVCPSFGANNLLLTNLTGHPCVVLPNGFNEEGSPTSITFMGRLYDEARLLALARAYQNATDFHAKHPPAFP